MTAQSTPGGGGGGGVDVTTFMMSMMSALQNSGLDIGSLEGGASALGSPLLTGQSASVPDADAEVVTVSAPSPPPPVAAVTDEAESLSPSPLPEPDAAPEPAPVPEPKSKPAAHGGRVTRGGGRRGASRGGRTSRSDRGATRQVESANEDEFRPGDDEDGGGTSSRKKKSAPSRAARGSKRSRATPAAPRRPAKRKASRPPPPPVSDDELDAEEGEEDDDGDEDTSDHMRLHMPLLSGTDDDEDHDGDSPAAAMDSLRITFERDALTKRAKSRVRAHELQTLVREEAQQLAQAVEVASHEGMVAIHQRMSGRKDRLRPGAAAGDQTEVGVGSLTHATRRSCDSTRLHVPHWPQSFLEQDHPQARGARRTAEGSVDDDDQRCRRRWRASTRTDTGSHVELLILFTL